MNIMTEPNEIFLEDCPNCRGVGCIQHEGGWCVYVECLDCGAQTAYAEYTDEASKEDATSRVVRLWNMGKVVKLDPGE